jgi:hypothetical protein
LNLTNSSWVRMEMVVSSSIMPPACVGGLLNYPGPCSEGTYDADRDESSDIESLRVWELESWLEETDVNAFFT